MCDFNTLDDTQKLHYHQILIQAAQKCGGMNPFLQLLEAIRHAKPHPLVATNREFQAPTGTIKWNKIIFNDKILLLQKARLLEGKQNNLLPDKKEVKQYKKVLNLIRTLKPIVFTVKPELKENGAGFFFQPFEIIDETTTKLNPLFDALFFCSIETVKRVLNYTPKAS